MSKLPRKITPSPIVESVLEVRFSSPLPEDAIFGVLYKEFKNDYPTFEQLPILQLPAAVRTQDPNLRFKPHYTTQKDHYVLQLGPRCFSISNVEIYVGWAAFSERIFATYDRVNQSGVIANIERIGLRYINILEGVNVFDNSTIGVSLNKNVLTSKTNVSSQIPFDKGFCAINISSDTEAQLGGPNGKKVIGSVIDIDTVVNANEFNDVKLAIEYAHDIGKELFFNLLKEEYIQTLNPEY